MHGQQNIKITTLIAVATALPSAQRVKNSIILQALTAVADQIYSYVLFV